jgi:uncharacterized protein
VAPEPPERPLTPEPARRLSPTARWLWRAQGAIATAAALAVSRAAPGGAVWLLLPIVVFGIGVVVIPELRWSRWRYEVRDEEIDLLRGVVTITRTLVPMQRVQHVDVQRGALERLLGFSSVIFHTAAGGTRIPALRPAEATAVRDRIATLTRTPDEL